MVRNRRTGILDLAGLLLTAGYLLQGVIGIEQAIPLTAVLSVSWLLLYFDREIRISWIFGIGSIVLGAVTGHYEVSVIGLFILCLGWNSIYGYKLAGRRPTVVVGSSLILFASGKIAYSKYDLIYTLLLGAAAIYTIRFDGFV